ncbi:MAG TPA: hypothetical protein VMZ26_01255 [Pyrinomonadaceae bacterium]|nr:hypothetical protein [Pyrinomonadaceae bacterium]
MSVLFKSWLLILFVSPFCFGQDPMPILRSGWERSIQRAPRPEVTAGGPVKEVTADTKYFARTAREARTDVHIDPTESTVTARSAAMDRAVQESRAPQADDLRGYSYGAEVRNDSGKTAEILFWEYRFTEIAHPENVVVRQFLCGGKLKAGEKRMLSAFSLLGPSETITLESLAKPAGKLFNEEVYINRIEFSDGSILQRDDWKYADVKASVVRATSTPWGKEVCRPL